MKHLISITLLLLYSTNAFSGSFLDLDEHGSVMRFGGQDFAYYENTTVKNWKALSSSNSKVRYRGEGVNNFIKSCLEKCASGDKGGPDGQCGGVALIYRDTNRTMPTMCLFASRESEVMPVGGSSRQTYDFYQQLCYPGGPYTEQCQKNNVQACWSGLDVGEDNKRTWFKVVDKDMPGMYFKKYGGKRNTRTISGVLRRKQANEHDYDFVNRCLGECISIGGKCKGVLVRNINSKPSWCRFTTDMSGESKDEKYDLFIRDETLANQQKCLRGLAAHGWEGGFRVDDEKQKQQMERTAVALCVALEADGNKSEASQCQETLKFQDWFQLASNKEAWLGTMLAYWCAYDWPNMAPDKRDDVNSLLSTNGGVDLCQSLYASAKLFESCDETLFDFHAPGHDVNATLLHKWQMIDFKLRARFRDTPGGPWVSNWGQVAIMKKLTTDSNALDKFLNSSFLHKGASLELEEERNSRGGISHADGLRIFDALTDPKNPSSWYHAWEFIPELSSALEHPQYGLYETLAWSHCGIDRWKARGYLGNWRY